MFKPETFFLIAGPCAIESEDLCLRVAEQLRVVRDSLNILIIFKSSFDKANRTSYGSFRGPGLSEGLRILEKVRGYTGLPVLSDIHNVEQAHEASEVLDYIQIPAFLCRQTDLIKASAESGLPVNIKKGQFLSPEEMFRVVEKFEHFGGEDLILTERGTFFGYNHLVNDMTSIPIMKEAGYPVVFDGTHSVQMPGGKGRFSGGKRKFVFPLCKSAVAIGADGLFLETHPNPEEALCDGSNMIRSHFLKENLERILEIYNVSQEKFAKSGIM